MGKGPSVCAQTCSLKLNGGGGECVLGSWEVTRDAGAAEGTLEANGWLYTIQGSGFTQKPQFCLCELGDRDLGCLAPSVVFLIGP